MNAEQDDYGRVCAELAAKRAALDDYEEGRQRLLARVRELEYRLAELTDPERPDLTKLALHILRKAWWRNTHGDIEVIQ